MKVNNLSGQIIIEELHRLGVDYFCIAPGSRSTPLTCAVAFRDDLQDFVHYDERGIAFHALGYAKATHKPAVIIITSGSSLANVFPAVIEAHYSRIPLIILSGDRPFELIDCGSNQAIDQVKFYNQYVSWQASIPLCDEKLPIGSICSTLGYAYAKSFEGPVHLNCHLREPFLIDQEVSSEEYERWKNQTGPQCHFSPIELKYNPKQLPSLPARGAIILGREVEEEDLEPIIELSKKLQYPIFADVLAAQSRALLGKTIENYEAIIKAKKDLKFDCILQFGHTFISKTLLLNLKKTPPKEYFLISSKLRRSDPNHLPSKHICAEVNDFCKATLSQPVEEDLSWLQFWKFSDQKVSTFLTQFFNKHTHLSEPLTLRSVFQNAKENQLFYIALSMPIRYALAYGDCPHPVKIYNNRGASGMDGNLATAFGISQGADAPITIVIGDATFLYDLNSLAMIQEMKHPPTIVVLNNYGCEIFSYLPIAEKKEIYRRYFHAEHSFTFEGAATQFKLSYFLPTTHAELCEVLQQPLGQAKLIEVQSSSSENVSFHKQLDSEIANALV